MTLKHSPGPWTIANDADGWDNIVDADGRLIAEVDSCSGGKDPDARLIAAAPTMLQLLRAILRNHRAADYGGMIKSLGDAAQFVERLDGDT